MRFTEQNLTQTVWFIDYDGSVCPHLEVWEERQYDAAEISRALAGLSKRGAEIFWNTGRRTDSLFVVYDDFAHHSGFFIQGSIFYDAKTKVTTRLGPAVPQAVIDQYVALAQNYPDFRLEIKETSLRLAAHKKEDLPELFALIAANPAVKTESLWHWRKGQRGVELLAQGFDKGTPIESHMKLHPGKVAIAIGDDVLDKPAVSAALRLGGYAFLVGDHCGWITEIPHWADQIKYFETPQMLLDWMERL